MAQFAPSLETLTYSTFLGGSGGDWGLGIALDPAGSAFVTGAAQSGSFPVTSTAFDTSYNDNQDAFVTKLSFAPRVSVGDVAREEGNAGTTTFAFEVALSSPSSQTVTVDYATADGSATAAGSDYTTTSGTVTFAPGETSKTVTVLVRGDIVVEPDEDLFVNLSGAVNAAIADGQGKGTIQNDDLSPTAPCTITGTPARDTLTGTEGDDVICALAGDDTVYGLGGRDVLRGGDGKDTLVGGDGSDLLLGQGGYDTLRGQGGNDTILGGEGGDALLFGGVGSDAHFGANGIDTIDTRDGVAGNDSAEGGNGSDICQFDQGDSITSCP